jgi:hypothetical protein
MTGDPSPATTATSTLGIAFAEAFAAKDYDRVRALAHPEVDFRGLTPNRFWEAHDPDGRFVVEQQAYLAERDGRIGWMRVVCSGFRPAD